MILKKIKPLYSAIITTKDKYSIDDVPKGSLIDPKKIQGSLKEHQTVLFIGTTVRDIKVGDIVKINPTAYAQYAAYKPGDGMRVVINGQEKNLLGYDIPTVEIDGKECLQIQERDVEYIVEEWEPEKEESDLIIPSQDIIK